MFLPENIMFKIIIKNIEENLYLRRKIRYSSLTASLFVWQKTNNTEKYLYSDKCTCLFLLSKSNHVLIFANAALKAISAFVTLERICLNPINTENAGSHK